MANATPTTPKMQFSSRLEEGMGVAHRKNPGGGRIALFGNTPLEAQNFRKFVTHKMDFLYNWECDTTNIWTLSNYNGATCTFAIRSDYEDGLGYFDVADTTNNHGGQFQFTAAASAGEFIAPYYHDLICFEYYVHIYKNLTTDWFIGIGNTDASFLGFADGLITGTHYIGFHHLVDDTQIRLAIGNGGTDLYTAITPTTALTNGISSFTRYGIRMEANNRFHWYIDDVWVGTMTVGDAVTGGTVEAFDDGDELCYTFASVNDTDTQGRFEIDYIASNITRNNDP